MKILITILLALFISSNAMAEERWTTIDVSEEYGYTDYIDEASIIEVGDSYFIWILRSYHEIQQVVTLPLKYYTFNGSSRMSLWEVSCVTDKYYPIVEYSFSEFMGKGIKIDTMNYTAPRWELWEYGSFMFPLINKRLCE